MVDILPFQGWRFAPDLPLNHLTAPPFDAITPAMQQVLHQRHDYNVVRLTRPLTDYQTAAQTLHHWQTTGVLVKQPAPALYGYHQQWTTPAGQCHSTTGLMALVALDGDIVPHEHTLYGPIQDRLRLLQALNTQTCPLFMLYDDDAASIPIAQPPAASQPVAADDGVTHHLWPITDAAFITDVQSTLKSKPLLIADGHHRFATLKQFYNGRGYAMVYLAPMSTAQIQPTHRGFTRLPFDVLAALHQVFTPVSLTCADITYHDDQGQAWGFCLAANTRDPIPVEQFETLVLQAMFNTSSQALQQAGVLRFYPDPHHQPALQIIQQQGLAALLHLKPPNLPAVLRHCQQGGRLPLKSTFFYPKPLSGLVMFCDDPQY